MKKLLSLIGLLGLMITLYGCGAGSGGSSTPPPAVSQTEYRPNQLVVRIKHDAEAENLAEQYGGEISQDFQIGDNRYLLLELNQPDIWAVQDQISRDSRVVFCEPNYVSQPSLVPNDPAYATNQYAPQMMGAQVAWDNTTGSDNLIIGVIDTGVDGTHPDLSSRMVAGWDYIGQRVYPANANYDLNGHGTHCAGILGAVGNNGVGITGICWNCRIMPLKVLGPNGGSNYNIAQAITYGTNNGAKVLNLSLGGPGYSQVVEDAVNYAVSRQVVLLVAMGNDGRTLIAYPAACQGVIAVGSTSADDTISSFSNRGQYISLTAPGSNIFSTYTSAVAGPIYRALSGTSMATPQVAGATGLLLTLRPALTAAEVKSQLESTADLKGGGFNETYGWGRMNLQKLLGPQQSNKYGNSRFTVNNAGQPVEGAELVIFTPTLDRQIATLLTNASGVAAFYLLPQGTYTVKVNYGGKSAEQSLTVTAGATGDYTLNLE